VREVREGRGCGADWGSRLRTLGGGGVWAEKPKRSHWGSVSGAPLETAMKTDRGRSQGPAHEATTVMGWCVRKCEVVGGIQAENPKPSRRARFRVCRVNRRWREVDVGGRAGRTRRQRSRGGAFANTTWGRGFQAENPKPSCRGSVSGLPCQTKVEVGGYRWWSGTYEATAVAGWRVRKRDVGEGVSSRKPETEPP
jgi:hypothetical protein